MLPQNHGATRKVLREFPPNPMLVNYHTRQELTAMMSERYTPDGDKSPEPWIAALTNIPGLQAVHIMRHKLRLKRTDRSEWNFLTPRIESILLEWWPGTKINEIERPDNLSREFSLPSHLTFESRQVIEGVRHAQSMSMAGDLYRIRGITTLIFYQSTLTIKRGACFPWEELTPQIEEILKPAH